ncbi:TetR/AcrR family transcriptional regulator [Streptomyces carpaticus]|uniref:TetR/AcrR family transcriptional regulator n=1 Tax=Streptomyces carpaticus TaxID=285558 RepID=A0ABV4ZFE5_9ACTN
MPRIQAASVAEHRSLQRGALLDAARSLLSEGGASALTFPALAARTGLARSSVYEYFRSRGAVVEALCAVDFPLWAAEVEAAVSAADSPREQVAAYVRAQLALACDARHRAVVAISAMELDTATREKIKAAHGGLFELIAEALRGLGHADPRAAAALLQGVVDAAVRRALAGFADPAEIAATAVRIALDGVAGAVPGERDAVDGQEAGGAGA